MLKRLIELIFFFGEYLSEKYEWILICMQRWHCVCNIFKLIFKFFLSFSFKIKLVLKISQLMPHFDQISSLKVILFMLNTPYESVDLILHVFKMMTQIIVSKQDLRKLLILLLFVFNGNNKVINFRMCLFTV